MKAFKFKAFIKLFETPQRNVKIIIEVNFFSLSGIGAGKVADEELVCIQISPFSRVHNYEFSGYLTME